jgi:hypothetical protein
MAAMPRPTPVQRLTRANNIRSLPYVAVILALVLGGILLGTGLASLQQGRALVAQLRAHSATSTAVVTRWVPEQVQADGGMKDIPQAAFGFTLPDGRLALTADTTFDGTFSAEPPPGSGTRYVVVRYDPHNVDVVLPAAVVAHPSYARSTAQAADGAGLIVVALAAGIWWWRRERRRRSVRQEIMFRALLASAAPRRPADDAEAPEPEPGGAGQGGAGQGGAGQGGAGQDRAHAAGDPV